MVKGSMQQEEPTILNIYAPRFIKQIHNDLQRDLDSHTIIVGDFNNPLSILDRKLTRNPKLELSSGQVDLIDIFRTLHPKSTDSTFFSGPHCTYSKVDHISEVKLSSANAKD